MNVEVIRDQHRLDALAEEWDDLYERCPSATPFQAHAWVAAWARAYCPPGRLRIVVVRSAGRLQAAAPFLLSRRGPWASLVPLGSPVTDYFDVLLPDPSGTAAQALIGALVDQPEWRVIDLPELRPESAALAWADRWPAGVLRLDDSPSVEFPAVPVSELVARVPGRTGNTLRRKARKMQTAGVDVRTVPAGGVQAALHDLLGLHEQQWRGRPINPEHLTRRYADFLSESIGAMTATGQAVVVEYRIGDELVASEVDLVGRRFLGYYLAGVSPGLREQLDVTSMLIGQGTDRARAHGLNRYSMLRGFEEFKLRWRPDVVRSSRLLLSRPGVLSGLGYPTAVRTRATGKRYIRDKLPWVRAAKHKVVHARARRSDRG